MASARTAGFFFVAVFTTLLFAGLAPLSAHATESMVMSPYSAGSGGSNGGGAAWVSSASTTSLASAARVSGGPYAEAALEKNLNTGDSGVLSQYLALTGFNFSLPAAAIVKGISVDVSRRAGVAGAVHDSEVRLVSGTVATSVNKALPGAWGNTFATLRYGGADDTWGRSWTPATVNSANFGIIISAINTDDSSGHGARVDAVTMTITYTLPPPAPIAQTYTIPLASGWSLISTPVALADARASSVFASTTADAVWSYDPSDANADASGWLVYDPAHPELSNLSDITTGEGYFVHASSTSALSVYGSLYAPGSSPPSRSLASGWNLVGSYASANEPIDDAFATIGWAGLEYLSLWKLDAASQAFVLPSSVGPGEAYWILLDAPHSYAPANL